MATKAKPPRATAAARGPVQFSSNSPINSLADWSAQRLCELVRTFAELQCGALTRDHTSEAAP
jgi:hypothetical protein